MLLSLSLIGIILSIILLYFKASKNASTIYLGGFFFLVSLYGFYQYILLYSKSVFLISLFLYNIAIICSPLYLIGPMLYWYMRSILTDNSRLKRNDIWHLLPMIIFFISAIPHAFIPWNEKVEVARTVVENAGFMEVYRATSLAKIFSPVTEYLTRPILVLGYTLWSAGLFINYLIKKKVSVVLSKQHFMKKWLCLFLGFLLILEITQILLIFRAFAMHFSELFFTLNVIRILSEVGLMGLLILPFFFPAILYGLPQVPEPPEILNRLNSLQTRATEKNGQNFESEYLHAIAQTITISMKEHQPYLHPDCNLASFSKLINIPPHHLAYYFREIKKQHFNDFRNEWRVNHAKALIQEGKASEITLEAIGSQSGFSSRNAFINDFKKLEGVSPGAYASRFN